MQFDVLVTVFVILQIIVNVYLFWCWRNLQKQIDFQMRVHSNNLYVMKVNLNNLYGKFAKSDPGISHSGRADNAVVTGEE